MAEKLDMKSFAVDRSTYDNSNEERLTYKAKPGLSEKLVREISKIKNEPEWMLAKRLEGFKAFNELELPEWGPDISELDISKLHLFMRPDAKKNATDWSEVPADIRKTYDLLGIPEAEKKALSGVGVQYESEVVYHNLKKEWADLGVVFLDCDEAVQQYPELVKKYFMTSCVPVGLHKFSALHAAVWSGGTFIYVPKGVKVNIPLQAYFRMNAKKGGQFEHTLIIVEEGAEMTYIEGCFSAGNLVASNPDYKKIEDIHEKDKVLTSEGDFMKINDLQRYYYSGDMYEVQIWGDSTQTISSTPEHPFLYVDRKRMNERNKTFMPRWNMPRFFKKGDYLVMPINKKVISKKTHLFEILRANKGKMKKKQIRVKLMPEFFRLVGYYLAEGSVSANSYLNFSFNINEKEYVADVKYCLEKVFGCKKVLEVIHKKNNGISIVVCSVDLARIFRQFGNKCDNKAILPWMMYEKISNQAEIIKGWCRGDGNYYNNRRKNGLKETFRINTTSEKLVRQGRDILLRLGIFGFINLSDRSHQGRRKIYALGITGEEMVKFGKIMEIKILEKLNGKKRASMFFVDSKFAYAPIKEIKIKKVEHHMVYNFAVNSHETYTVAGVAVHNCSAPQYSENSLHAGCVEIHVLKGGLARYSSIENWSKNTYNLNTKRAVVHEDATIEWINGNMGSKATMLYPCSILVGDRSKSSYIGVAFAGRGQYQDTGCKVYHLGKNTGSTIVAKSISKDGGIASYRGLLSVKRGAINTTSSVTCDTLMIDNISKSNTYPSMDIKEKSATIAHEATVGKISEDQLFYLMSRGISKEDATKMIVAGFIEPVVAQLPIEYAVELNRLIELEMEGSLG